MYKQFYLIFLLGLIYSNSLVAQDKFEKESRIKRSVVPLKALVFMDSLHYNTKIKWYEEDGLTRKSFEAKFKYKKTKYSIEFDTLGTIEDVEIDVNWSDIKLELANSFSRQLKLDCSKHKIVKIQKQFTGNEYDLFSLLRNGTTIEQLKIKYEIVVKCHEQKEVNLFEYLFNEKGIYESKAKIIFKNSSHLEY